MRNESAFESPGKALRLRAVGLGVSVFARGGFAVLNYTPFRRKCASRRWLGAFSICARWICRFGLYSISAQVRFAPLALRAMLD